MPSGAEIIAFCDEELEYRDALPKYLICRGDWWREEVISYRDAHKPKAGEGADAETLSVEGEFFILAEKWRKETGGYSLNMRRYAHPAYQEILMLGGREKAVVRLILNELKQRPDYWFEALKILTKQNPASEAKTFDEAVKSWLAWGAREKLLS